MRELATQSDRAATIWFTGLPGSGKTTLARRLELEIRNQGLCVEVLDGDRMREILSAGLGYSKQDRDSNVTRIGFVSNLLSRNGVFALASAIAPYRETRKKIRLMHGSRRFVEIHVSCPVSVLIERDKKGVYGKARRGEIARFTGISDPYEAPENPEIVVHTDIETEAESHDRILNWLCKFGYLPQRVLPRRDWIPIHMQGVTALFEEDVARSL